MNDLRFALRQLLKNPGFTVVAVVTLALGIGANTAIFSVVNAVLLKPLPYPEPNRLVRIASVNPGLGLMDSRSSGLNVLDWQRQSTVFEGIAAFQEWDGVLTFRGKSESARINWVTPNLMPMLGLRPLLGGLLPEEATAAPGLVLPYEVWNNRFGADPAVIGQSVSEDGVSNLIVGVLPPGVAAPAQGWLPLDQAFVRMDLPKLDFPRDWQLFNVIGRLKPGISVEQAQAELSRIATQLEELHPESNRGWGVKVTDLKTWMSMPVRSQLMIVYSATAIILLIACLNVSNLLLIRSAARRRELAIRRALGSSRSQIAGLWFSESAVLAAVGCAAGLLVAILCQKALLAIAPESLGVRSGSFFELPVLVSALGSSALAVLVFSLIPALRWSQGDLNQVLVESGRSASPGKGRHRLLHGLVAGQIAVSTALLVAAGLAVVSFQNLMRVDPGFARQNSICFRVGHLPDRQIGERVLEALAMVPGVQAAGAAHIELLNDVFSNPVRITVDDGAGLPGESAPTVNFWLVTKDYFSATGVPLLAGRVFTERDDTNAPAVAIINEALVKRHFGNEDPIGKIIRIPDTKNGRPGQPRQIVGVVGSVRQHGLREPAMPVLYSHYTDFATGSIAVTVRTKDNPLAMLPALRSAIRNVNPELLMNRILTTEEIVARSFASERFSTWLMFAFAALGTLLAALGLYGVLAYAVSLRTQEMGIRMALGAQRGDVFGMIMQQGMLLVVFGMVAGLLAAVGLGRLMESLLFDVSPADPLTLVTITLLMSLVALLACWLPARRAARVDPMEALRSE